MTSLPKSQSTAFIRTENAPVTPLPSTDHLERPLRYYSKTSPDYPTNYFLGQMQVDDLWFDAYRKFRPLQSRSLLPHRYYAYGDYIPSYPYYYANDSYLNRYKKYFGKDLTPFPSYRSRHDVSHPSHFLREQYYSPYRSWVNSV